MSWLRKKALDLKPGDVFRFTPPDENIYPFNTYRVHWIKHNLVAYSALDSKAAKFLPESSTVPVFIQTL